MSPGGVSPDKSGRVRWRRPAVEGSHRNAESRRRLRCHCLGVGDVFFVGALEVFDVAVVEVPDAGGDFVDQIVIVGDQQHGTRVLLEGEVEGVDGLEIEVIGRFVQYQEVGLLEHQATEDEAGRFAAGQRLGGLEGVVAGEQHLAEKAAQFLLRGLRIELVQPLDGGHAVGDGIGVILREVADGDFVAPDDDAWVKGEVALALVDVTGGGADEGLQ